MNRKRALKTARDLVADICECGCMDSEHVFTDQKFKASSRCDCGGAPHDFKPVAFDVQIREPRR